MSDLKLGFIGFGEVGTTISRGIRENDPTTPIHAFDLIWDARRRGIADELRVRVAPSLQELVAQSTVVVCAVTPQAALPAARAAAPFLQAQHLYVDLTSVGPARARDIALIVGERGARFVKLALMGAIAAFGYRVPCAASGTGTWALAEHLTPRGMKIQVLNDDPAAAATLKLCRSIFQKGIAALAVEALRIARKNGVEQEVLDSLAETWDAEGFAPALNRLVVSSVTHASRRAAELDEAIESFAEMGLATPLAQASRQAFDALIALQKQGNAKNAQDLRVVLDALEETRESQ